VVSHEAITLSVMALDRGVGTPTAQTNRNRAHPSSKGTFISGCERFSENSQDPSTRR